MSEKNNLEELVNDFIWNRNIIDKVSNDNALTISYLVSMSWYDYIPKSDFIKSLLLWNIFNYNWEVEIKNLIYNIENIKLDDYIIPIITKKAEDTVWTYFYFNEYINIRSWDKDIIEILKRAQYEWLHKLYYDTLNQFLIYIKNYYV